MKIRNYPLDYNAQDYEERWDFYKEIKYLAKKYNVNETSVIISLMSPEGVIFIDGNYAGYLDSCFYNEMDNGKCLCDCCVDYFEEN